ncbi:hypothetical protein NKH77_36790 [Streptomyces sp. M19]
MDPQPRLPGLRHPQRPARRRAEPHPLLLPQDWYYVQKEADGG